MGEFSFSITTDLSFGPDAKWNENCEQFLCELQFANGNLIQMNVGAIVFTESMREVDRYRATALKVNSC